MPDASANSSRRLSLKFKLLVLGGVIAAVLVIVGLATEPLEIEHQPVPWFERIPLLFMSFTSDGWFIGKNEGAILIVGSILARVIFLSAILLAVWALFSREIRAIALSRRRDHIVVIGNTPTAREVVGYLASRKRKATHVVADDTESADVSSRSLVALPLNFTSIARAAGLAKAKRIVVDTGDLSTNMALVRGIRQAYGDKAPPISCNIESNDTADEFGDLLGVRRDILIYDEARLSVRDTLARHPLYASADRQGAARVHLVIIGFGQLGRVLLEEAVQDSIAGTLAKPFVTVIDWNADVRAAAFAREKPEHDMAADVAFIACDVLAAPLDAEGSLHRAALFGRDTEAAVTAIAFCFEKDADNVAAALALRTMRRRSGRCFAPIFMPLQDPEGSGRIFNLADKDRIVDPLDSIIPIGLSREALAVGILGEGERDHLAKRFHATFRALADESQTANVSWVALPETYRRADRHAADHIPAKLWSLGLATERQSSDSLLAIDRDWQRQWAQEVGQTERLERIEHERWIADRVMEGWRHALTRDDDLRQHNDLAPFDMVGLKDQDKDRKQIELISTIIKESSCDKGKRFMPEFVVGFAAGGRHSQALSAATHSEIGRRLAQPLADLSAHYVITIVSSLTAAEFSLIDAFASAFKQWVKRKARWNRSFAEDADLRLVVLEGVPYASYLKSVNKDAKTSEHRIHMALEARRELFNAFNRVEVVRIGARGLSNDAAFRDPAVVEEGGRSVNAYLARRADMLCVFARGETATLPMPLAELDMFWNDVDTIPQVIDPGPSRRGAPRPDVDMKRYIRIDI
jgi:hypothetical protein